ncbi:signal recognition particle, SRP9/SRP14 subunit [Clavulina sp. PMI_390]|nr:signal recognition particle, SRP9/SRP14 subunit [Clavulina sp. PMI_390]
MVAAPGLVDKDEFITRLTELFASKKTGGSIWIRHRRLTHDGADRTMAAAADDDDDREYPCILKVTDGKEFKMSTHISSAELPAFHAAYGSLLRASMTTMKKRDKKKERAKLEKAELRRQKLAKDVVISAPKRGSGRRKFQRQMKAAVKQIEAREKQVARDEARAKKHPTAAN